MQEQELRDLIADVKTGRLTRRAFVQRMVALGLTAPMAFHMLAYSGVAMADTRNEYKPTKRGGGGALKALWWQGATLLNPHFAVGTKDQEGSRIFYEPLAAWDADGGLVPVLAAEIPSVENGGLARDGRSVTWKLKQGVQWHDGRPFTADDVVFNWEYAVRSGNGVDDHRQLQGHQGREGRPVHGARAFAKPTPFWADAFVSSRGMMHPQASVRGIPGRQVARCADQPEARRHRPLPLRRLQARRHGARRAQSELSRREPAALRHHRDEGRRRRGVGRARRASRPANTTTPGTCRSRTKSSCGWRRAARDAPSSRPAATSSTSSSTARIPGRRSMASGRAPRPGIRCSPTLPCARRSHCSSIAPRSRPTSTGALGRHREFPQQPGALPLEKHQWEFNVDKANQLLDAAGWKRGADGIRAKDGKKLKLVFQTSINTPRQKTQAIVKQACQKAGIERRAEVGDGLGRSSRPTSPIPTPSRSSTATSRCTRRP